MASSRIYSFLLMSRVGDDAGVLLAQSLRVDGVITCTMRRKAMIHVDAVVSTEEEIWGTSMA